MREIVVRSAETFNTDFPQVVVGPRSTRTQDKKDLWGARRTLHTLYAAGTVSGQTRIRKITETTVCSTPDFEFCSSFGFGFMEITEATHPDDQRELAQSERMEGPILVGSLGARGGNRGWAGDAPERMVAEDIVDAINRKSKKYALELRSRMVLGIYINSAPGSSLHEFERLSPHLDQARSVGADFSKIVIFQDRDAASMVLAPKRN
jgi:hypothetical protein